MKVHRCNFADGSLKMGMATHNFLRIGSQVVPLRFKYNKSAKRLILRTEAHSDEGVPGVVLTVPTGITQADAFAWASSQTSWVRRSVAKVPKRVPFCDGTAVPVGGVNHVIQHSPGARRGVWVADGTIFVSGRREHLQRRVADWLKKEARRRITERVRKKTNELGVHAGRISIRDTRSRWGSCSYNGNLNFSWRLILMPMFVFDYVISHEVAHLREHNHGPAFWHLVNYLTPDSACARAWLTSTGPDLYKFY